MGDWLGVLPAHARSVQLPLDTYDIQTYRRDRVYLLAFDFPGDFNQGFDTTQVFGYESSSISLWTHPPLAETLENLF